MRVLAVHHHRAVTAELEALAPAFLARGHQLAVLVRQRRLLVSERIEATADCFYWDEIAPARPIDGRLYQHIPATVNLWMRTRYLRRQIRRLEALVDRIQPDVILSFDRVPLDPVYLLRVIAERRGIPVIQVPFAEMNMDSLFILRQGQYQFGVDAEPLRSRRRRVAARWQESVRRDRNGRSWFFFDGLYTMALEALGVTSPNPWVPGDGCERFCLFSQAELASACEAGLDARKAVVTGQPSLTNLVRGIRNRETLRAEFENTVCLSRQSRICIFSPTALVESLLATPEHFWLHAERVVKRLSAYGWTVVVSLHPKMDPDIYEGRFRDLGAKVLPGPLSQWLAAADLYVTYASSTVRWSSAIGVPTVVADFLKLGYGYGSRLPGVAGAASFEELDALLAAPPAAFSPEEADLERMEQAPLTIVREAESCVDRTPGGFAEYDWRNGQTQQFIRNEGHHGLQISNHS